MRDPFRFDFFHWQLLAVKRTRISFRGSCRITTLTMKVVVALRAKHRLLRLTDHRQMLKLLAFQRFHCRVLGRRCLERPDDCRTGCCGRSTSTSSVFHTQDFNLNVFVLSITDYSLPCSLNVWTIGIKLDGDLAAVTDFVQLIPVLGCQGPIPSPRKPNAHRFAIYTSRPEQSIVQMELLLTVGAGRRIILVVPPVVV